MLIGLNSQTSNLVRVRNNQRRSRARRREYIAELERKVEECKEHGLQPCIPEVVPQNTILQLKEENRKLRELLALAGLEQTLVDAHLSADGGAPEAVDSGSRMQSSSGTTQEGLVSLENGIL
jgi:regulator of replication initiation timing